MKLCSPFALALHPALAGAQTDAEALVELNSQDAPLERAAEL